MLQYYYGGCCGQGIWRGLVMRKDRRFHRKVAAKMLDPRVTQLAIRQIENHHNDSERQLAVQLSRIASQAAAHGASRSGMTAIMMAEACATEIRVRASRVLDAFTRALGAVGQALSEEDARQFRAVIAEQVHEAAGRVRAVLDVNSTYQSLTRSSAISETRCVERLRQEEQAAKDAVDTEAELFLIASSAPESGDAVGSRSHVNIHNYGTVGAIQTGSGTSASFSITINQAERGIITDALADLRSAIEELGAADFPPADDTLGAIDAVSRELSGESPNKVTVFGLFGGIAAAVSAVASLRPAYDTLKSAAAVVGVNLP
jgi:hypothetical protein